MKCYSLLRLMEWNQGYRWYQEHAENVVGISLIRNGRYNMKYEMVKMFNALNMPSDIADAIMTINDYMDQPGVFTCEYTVHEEPYGATEEEKECRRILDEWLVKNGAEPSKDGEVGETVIITAMF